MSSPEARLKAFYAPRAAEEPTTDPEAELRFRKALAAAELAPGQRLLDIGAKWGGLGRCARELGLAIEYTGLELDEENVRKAATLGLDVRLGDASGLLPVDGGAYDCVV